MDRGSKGSVCRLFRVDGDQITAGRGAPANWIIGPFVRQCALASLSVGQNAGSSGNNQQDSAVPGMPLSAFIPLVMDGWE